MGPGKQSGQELTVHEQYTYNCMYTMPVCSGCFLSKKALLCQHLPVLNSEQTCVNGLSVMKYFWNTHALFIWGLTLKVLNEQTNVQLNTYFFWCLRDTLCKFWSFQGFSKSLPNLSSLSRSVFMWPFTTMLSLHGVYSTWVILSNILCHGSSVQLMQPPMTRVRK